MKRQVKKRVLILSLIAGLSIIGSLSAYAGEWLQDEVGWKYENDDSSNTVNNWQKINDRWYYFDENGYILREVWTPDNYYVGINGMWVEDLEEYQRLREIDIRNDIEYREKYGPSGNDEYPEPPVGIQWTYVPGLGMVRTDDPRVDYGFGHNGYDDLSPKQKKEYDELMKHVIWY